MQVKCFIGESESGMIKTVNRIEIFSGKI